MYVIASAQHGGAGAGEGDFNQHPNNPMSNGPTLRAMLENMDRWATDARPRPRAWCPVARTAHSSGGRMSSATTRSFTASTCRRPPAACPSSTTAPTSRGSGHSTPAAGLSTGRSTTCSCLWSTLTATTSRASARRKSRSPSARTPAGACVRKAWEPGDFFSLSGSFVPFARTKAEREAKGDPRPSIEERTPATTSMCSESRLPRTALVSERLLLQEDADRYVAAARKRNPLDPNVPLAPLVLTG